MKRIAPLLITGICAAILLALVGYWTKPKIQANRAAFLNVQYKAVQLLVDEAQEKQGATVAKEGSCHNESIVLTRRTKGYGGDIETVLGFIGNELVAVRVANHAETPGFSDILNPEGWIGLFGNRPSVEIHAVTRSTITSRAILNAVTQAEDEATLLIERCLGN